MDCPQHCSDVELCVQCRRKQPHSPILLTPVLPVPKTSARALPLALSSSSNVQSDGHRLLLQEQGVKMSVWKSFLFGLAY